MNYCKTSRIRNSGKTVGVIVVADRVKASGLAVVSDHACPH